MNLETKRNAIMNAIASGQLTNILSNKTWSKGYFLTNGSIASQNITTKEMYTEDYIELDTTKDYVLIMSSDTSRQFWFRSVFYKSDYSVSSNTSSTLQLGQNGYFMILPFVMASGSQYFRMSFRAWSGTDIAIVEMDEIQQWLDSKVDYENVSGE